MGRHKSTLFKVLFTGRRRRRKSQHIQAKEGEAAIWQRRYWEHCIRDEQDYIRHLDYIHYNPVKHNLVKNVSEWKWSSFHKYKAKGYYPEGWGENEEVLSIEGEFGE